MALEGLRIDLILILVIISIWFILILIGIFHESNLENPEKNP